MIKYKRIIREIISIFLCLTFLVISSITVQADEPEDGYGEKIEFNTTTGIFTFTTIDTKATSSIKWKTVGFTVCKVPTQGYPRKDTDGDPKTKDYAIFELSKGDVYQEEYDSTHWLVTFTFTKEQVNAAFNNTTLDEVKAGETIYFNGIFHVIYDGVEDSHDYYNLTGKPNGIATAESWANGNDFSDRFDRWVKYSPGSEKYPIIIERRIYSNGTSTVHDSTDYPEQTKNTTFTTNWHNVAKEINTNGKEYFLYRLYYVNLREPTKIVGNRKTSVSPYLSPTEYTTALSYLRDRDYTVKDKGLKIVALYRRFTENTISSEDSMSREAETIDPTAVIKADTRGSEAYEVLEGIPGTESLYVNAITSKYLSAYNFIQKEGTKLYPVNVTKTYTLTWADTDEDDNPVPRSRTVPVTKTYYIERKYSYWYIDALSVYGLDKAVIQNDALPSGSVTLIPSGYTVPTVSYTNSTAEADHIIEPVYNNITLPGQALTGGNSEPSIPDDDWKTYAENIVVKIKCKNDKLIFNGQTIMSNAAKEEAADTPLDIPEGVEEIGINVLYKSSLVIPGTTANEEFESAGTVTYRPIVNISNEESMEVESEYEFDDINSVVVHTPVVCDGMVQDNRSDNQMITPDVGRASLVLDRPFYVTLPTTGSHRDIPGYGYRDYRKYISARQVKFAFDVYKGDSTAGTYISKNTWTSVTENTLFFVPSWVSEGRYEIRFRSTAINAAANNSTENVETLANLNLDNYAAEDSSIVQISGRIYGLNIYDITDYPIWEKVFRIPDSLKLTGFHYTVGTKDQNGSSNGQEPKYTLTMINGSHPKYKNQGILKTGYMTRFSLTTVGSMADKDDYVKIKPKFYFVDKNGQNRQEADIYYSETFNGKQNVLVKMGSSIDLQNDKTIKTGDVYLGIPESELQRTAYFEGVTLKQWKSQEKKIYNFMNIMLPSALRTFIGSVSPIPAAVTEKQVASSVQRWYGEYYLPADIHIAPKGFDVNRYAVSNGGLNYHESFWLTGGYIIVNFDITTLKDGEPNLSYINERNSPNGYCNMWNREGYQYQKTSYGNISFNFQDGDYIIYYTDKSVNDDWKSGGTH